MDEFAVDPALAQASIKCVRAIQPSRIGLTRNRSSNRDNASSATPSGPTIEDHGEGNEIYSALRRQVSQLHTEVKFAFASVTDDRPRRRQTKRSAAWPNAARMAGAHAPQRTSVSRPPGLQRPAKRKLSSLRPRRSPVGRGWTGGSETPANGRLPATDDIVHKGPQRPKRSDSRPVDPSPARQAAP